MSNKNNFIYRKAQDASEINECVELINNVFNVEKGFNMQKFDKYHHFSTYYGLWVNNNLISCFRMISNTEYNLCSCLEMNEDLRAHIGSSRCIEVSRVVITEKYRGKGMINILFMFLREELKNDDIDYIVCEPLLQTLAMYTKYGFLQIGESFYDSTVDIYDNNIANCCFVIAKPENIKLKIYS